MSALSHKVIAFQEEERLLNLNSLFFLIGIAYGIKGLDDGISDYRDTLRIRSYPMFHHTE